MSRPIFISYSSKDGEVARKICTDLEDRGYGCWIAARDVDGGEIFSEAIVKAIRSAKIMLLVFTANANDSDEIKKELALASQRRLIVIPVRVEDVSPGDAFAYEFAIRQWIDLFPEWIGGFERLDERLAGILAAENAAGEAPRQTPFPPVEPFRASASVIEGAPVASSPAHGMLTWFGPHLILPVVGWALIGLALAGFARWIEAINMPLDFRRMSRAQAELFVLLLPAILILTTGLTGLTILRRWRSASSVGTVFCFAGLAWAATVGRYFAEPLALSVAAIVFAAALICLLLHRYTGLGRGGVGGQST